MIVKESCFTTLINIVESKSYYYISTRYIIKTIDAGVIILRGWIIMLQKFIF